MPVLCYTIFVNIITHILMSIWLSYKLKLQKRNNEGIDNAPDPVYSWNISEGEAVRQMLLEDIKTSLPDHLATWKMYLNLRITFMQNRWGYV